MCALLNCTDCTALLPEWMGPKDTSLLSMISPHWFLTTTTTKTMLTVIQITLAWARMSVRRTAEAVTRVLDCCAVWFLPLFFYLRVDILVTPLMHATVWFLAAMSTLWAQIWELMQPQFVSVYNIQHTIGLEHRQIVFFCIHVVTDSAFICVCAEYIHVHSKYMCHTTVLSFSRI